MNRRSFVSIFVDSLLAVPLLANAQQATKVYRIGLLKRGADPIQKPFWDAMRGFGWIENENVKIEPRYAVTEDQLPKLAAELVRSQVDLILTQGTSATRAAKQATDTIPVVFTVGSDPVQAALIANMARPGANLTGFAYGLYQEKSLEILKEALPTISRVAYPVFGEPESGILRAAKLLHVEVSGIPVKGPEDFGPFFVEAQRARANAVVIQDVAWFTPHLGPIAAESLKRHLPAIGYRRAFAEAGGLMSYGPPVQHYPRLAAQVDKILRGAKAGDLPIEQPTIFEFVVNLKTAKLLGLTLPPSILIRADERIE